MKLSFLSYTRKKPGTGTHIILTYTSINRVDLTDILARSTSTADVPLLLQVLQLTLEFESQLETRFMSRVSNERDRP